MHGLKSHDSSSKILESKSVNKKQAQAQKSHREQLSLESTFSQSHDSKSNAHFLSLRADLSARQSISPDLESSNLDSSFSSSRGVAEAKQGKLCHLPFPDESFEVVTMLAVLEHLHHPHAMLQEIARVLKPSGALVLTVPSHAAKPVLEFLAFRLKIVSEAEIADHKRYYNKRDLRELVALVPELTLTKHTYFQLGMNNFAIIHKRG